METIVDVPRPEFNQVRPPNFPESVHGRCFLVVNAVGQIAFERKPVGVGWVTLSHDQDFDFQCCHSCLNLRLRENQKRIETVRSAQLDLDYSG